jgi:hypothetical protein
LTLVVNGGSFTSKAGFFVPSIKIDGATINTKGAAFEINKNGEISNCTITTGNAMQGSAPAAGVAVCNNGTATVSNCKITTGGTAFYVYSSGGTITATNCTVTGTVAAGTSDGTITVDGVKQ